MDKSLRSFIESALGSKLTSAVPVSGGDIASAYKLEFGGERWFCKYQKGGRGFDMLRREKEGLEAIGETGLIRTPEILFLGNTEDGGLLIMEFVDSRSPSDDEMELFGRQLVQLHNITADRFGWKTGNYIGSLPQSNSFLSSWSTFYSRERLLPQLMMARDKGLLSPAEIPQNERIESQVKKYFRPSAPSMVHGDLWSGNYLITLDGEPCLIDPSVSYSHPGMDLAMSRLFGGFTPSFYEAYGSSSPLPMPDQAETDLCQLYYLLVHLNLFGASYASSVRNILKRYF